MICFVMTMAPPAKRQKHLKENSFAAATDGKVEKQTEHRKQAVVVKWEGISDNLAVKKETPKREGPDLRRKQDDCPRLEGVCQIPSEDGQSWGAGCCQLDNC
jgi:hypothetical protein